MADWKFAEPPKVAVLTTRNVALHGGVILFVSHDEDDGMCQFHEGSNLSEDTAMVISLEEAVAIDPSITDVADLPRGWHAWRDAKGQPWKRAQSEL